MAHHHDTKQVLNRLSRAIGHLEAVKKNGGRWAGLQSGADSAGSGEVCPEQYGKNHSERPYQPLHCGGCGNRGQKSSGRSVDSHRPVHEMRGFL